MDSYLAGRNFLNSGLKEIKHRMLMIAFCAFGIGLGIGALFLFTLQKVF